MQVIEYLKQYGLDKLTEEFAIKVKKYDEEGLIVLNYDQIDSPKTHPIVMECRSLIVDNNFDIVSRSFDRFFNVGEAPDTQQHLDMDKAEVFDKIDGSLIKIYWYGGEWNIATRGTAFAESTVNGFDVTFRELVLKALGMDANEFQEKFDLYCNPANTYICEVTSVENRVVRKYNGYNLYYLATRNNKSGAYVDYRCEAKMLGMIFPKSYKFNSTEACIETAKHLKDLDEGYVVYQDGAPVCKIKSPTYVAVHHIRGEGLNPKRISQIVLTGEHEEYLSYFPEDRHFIEPYVEALSLLQETMSLVYSQHQEIESQKDFALAVKDYPFSGVLFTARKTNKDIEHVFNATTEIQKIKMLSEAMNMEI